MGLGTESSQHATPADTGIRDIFLQDYLDLLGQDIYGRQGDQQLVKDITDSREISERIVVPLTQILNNYSERVFNKLVSNQPPHPYIFLNSKEYVLADCKARSKTKNDIVVVSGPRENYPKLDGPDNTHTWSITSRDIVSLVNNMKTNGKSRRRVIEIAKQVLRSRPDMVGTWLVWARVEGYSIQWSDASGAALSPSYSWNDLAPLAAYVCSLYRPHRDHIQYDSSITPEVKRGDLSEPTWSIKLHRGQTYTGCRLLFTGSAWGRRTFVWKNTDECGRVTVIKDAFLGTGRHRTEADILAFVHRNGIIPGVVRILSCGDPSPFPPIKTLRVPDERWSIDKVRTRLLLGSYGETLWQARTVKDILMAIFDIVEVHRELCINRNVLHQDISPWNMVMYPKHHPDTMKGQRLVENPPMLISQILRRDKESHGKDEACGLLIDFDRAVKMVLEPEGVVNQERRKVTGTQMFAARAFAEERRICIKGPSYKRTMPTLEGDVKELYEFAYGAEAYERYSDASDTIHGSRHIPFKGYYLCTEPDIPPPIHMPHHDAESIFWVLFYVLLHAQPLERTDGVNMAGFWTAREWFHEVDLSPKSDSREKLMMHDFRIYFDPKLEPITNFLRDLAWQVIPEYDEFDPPPAPEHLHEAMRRLLLQAIHTMQDPIALDPGVTRPLYVPRDRRPRDRRTRKDCMVGPYTEVFARRRARPSTSDEPELVVKRRSLSPSLDCCGCDVDMPPLDFTTLTQRTKSAYPFHRGLTTQVRIEANHLRGGVPKVWVEIGHVRIFCELEVDPVFQSSLREPEVAEFEALSHGARPKNPKVPGEEDSDDDGKADLRDFVGVDKGVEMETNKLKRKMNIEPDDTAQQDTKLERPREVDSIIM
ncbi:hypothetical protein NLI96_g775 [Meripilus lineatus]|uniref:Fungal-type protein kinase domain-containing protein n=1 Tax=Meripilus lineatus TaxID=2056292 RepID=A0AAD5YIZ8_9APHY|nr:hypothetical protein NLI96_g775 [Physisporinus lineatus]